MELREYDSNGARKTEVQDPVLPLMSKSQNQLPWASLFVSIKWKLYNLLYWVVVRIK